jgi:hypothetical protein
MVFAHRTVKHLPTFGFIVTYALVCAALPRYLRDHGAFRPGPQIVPWLALAAVLAALAGNLYPVPEDRTRSCRTSTWSI